MTNSSDKAWDIPVLAVGYWRVFARVLASKGIGNQALVQGTGVDLAFVEQPDGFLSMRQLARLIERIMSLVEDECLPFELGKQLDLVAHGLAGYTLLSKADHKQLITMIVHQQRVTIPILEMEVSFAGDTAVIVLSDHWGLGEVGRFITKVYLGSIYTLATRLSRQVTLKFSWPSRASLTHWQALAPRALLEFASDASEARICTARTAIQDPELSTADLMALVSPSEICVAEAGSERLVGRVRQIIESCPGRECSLENTAEALGMNPRSLRNHLAELGTSFRDIRNEIRLSFANRYLCDTNLSLDAIASWLGFSDQASFNRAYRAWTGTTPGEVRRINRGA
ncbi:MAG: AraC family transcriptional regulator [Marinobacter sp.]|nr:AraC family transcriptional regulator [Marinobacter sp.]